jgi:hypothetical protein
MSKNILKFLKEHGIKMEDAIEILSKEKKLQEELITGEEKEERRLAAEKAKKEAEVPPPAPEPEVPPKEEEIDIEKAIVEAVESKLKNMEVNLTNHINESLKIPRKPNPPGEDVSPERAAELNAKNKIEMNHFEIKV